jgi:predicted amino acid-binding ACT domain protein
MNLRPAKLKEMIPGSIFYRKEDDGSFSTCKCERYPSEEYMQIYRNTLIQAHNEGLLYLRKDNPGYPLSEFSEVFTQTETNIENQKQQQHMEPVMIMYSNTEHGSTEAHRKRLMDELEKLPEGNYMIKIQSNDIKGNPRGRYFAMLKVIVTDTQHDRDTLHEMFKKMYNDGHSTNVFKNDREWYDYINKVKAFAETEMGIPLPDPKAMTYEQLEHIDAQYNRSFNY